MAQPRTQRTMSDDATQAPDDAPTVEDTPVADAGTAPDTEMPAPPTLDAAFYLLCAAMAGHLEDNLPALLHCEEIQAWMMNAGDDAAGRAQAGLAWLHAVQLLEGIIGVPLLGR